MLSEATAKCSVLGRSEDFRHFLWRRHPQAASLDGFMPELLATDGRAVRRMIGERKQLIFQHFECERTAEAIIRAVESHATGGVGVCGYSMYSDADALAILHTGQKLDAGWLAFPYQVRAGRPIGMPTLPLHVYDTPTIRLCAGTQLRWKECRLVLDVAIEQRADDIGGLAAAELLDYLVSLRLRATVLDEGSATSVNLATSRQPSPEIRRTSARRAEATFEIDSTNFRRLAEREDLRTWLVLDFDRRLFCLPSEWCAWWFQVRLPRQIQD